MSWIAAKSLSDRIRPSEINGCTVQEVCYLDVIDDEYVLEALERLRGRSLTVPVEALVTTKTKEGPPRTPKQQVTQQVDIPTIRAQGINSHSSANSSTVSLLTMGTSRTTSLDSGNVAKGSHRSFDLRKKQCCLPPAMKLTPDSSVASSISSRKYSNNTDQGKVADDAPKKMTWAWFAKYLSHLHCGGLPMANGDQDGDSTTPNRMIPLGVFNRHLVQRCGGGSNIDFSDNDEEDEKDQSLNSDTVITNDEQSTIKGDEGNVIDSRNVNFKSQVAHLLDLTAKILVEGRFGDSDSVTLYTNNKMDTIYGEVENESLDGTFLTSESATYDDVETTSLVEAPDDEMHHDLTKGKSLLVRKGNRSFTTLGTATFASDGSSEGDISLNVGALDEGQEIDQDGLPNQLLVVGYDPPEDCSLRSESSELFIQAFKKNDKVIN